MEVLANDQASWADGTTNLELDTTAGLQRKRKLKPCPQEPHALLEEAESMRRKPRPAQVDGYYRLTPTAGGNGVVWGSVAPWVDGMRDTCVWRGILEEMALFWFAKRGGISGAQDRASAVAWFARSVNTC